MTSIDQRPDSPTEVLDLYDVLPAAPPTPVRTEDDPVTRTIKEVGRNLAAIIGLFFVYLAAFIVCTTLFSVGAGLVVIVVGLFILVGLPGGGRERPRGCHQARCSRTRAWSCRRRTTPTAGPDSAALRRLRIRSPGGTCCTS